MRGLKGRRYIVTGGATGIGAATAKRLAEEGASVAIIDLRLAQADTTAKQIAETGGKVLALEADVANETAMARAVAVAADKFGGLDGAVGNAGTAGRGWIHETALSDWQFVLGVNLGGVFLLAKHVIPHLLKAGGGAIVTTGSIASMVVGPGGSAASYASSKGGVLQLTRQIAVDYARHNIRANCVMPGAVKTELGTHSREDRQKASTPEGETLPRPPVGSPIARAADPSEIAAVIAFLLSDEASFVTGAAIPVDGGFLAV